MSMRLIRRSARGGKVRGGLAALVVVFPLMLAAQGPAEAATSSDVTFHSAATLTGPITVGHIVEPESAHPLELAAAGYEEK